MASGRGRMNRGKLGPLTAVLVTACLSGAVTLAVVLVPSLHLAYREPSLRVALETAASLTALLVAYLVYGRARPRRAGAAPPAAPPPRPLPRLRARPPQPQARGARPRARPRLARLLEPLAGGDRRLHPGAEPGAAARLRGLRRGRPADRDRGGRPASRPLRPPRRAPAPARGARGDRAALAGARRGPRVPAPPRALLREEPAHHLEPVAPRGAAGDDGRVRGRRDRIRPQGR